MINDNRFREPSSGLDFLNAFSSLCGKYSSVRFVHPSFRLIFTSGGQLVPSFQRKKATEAIALEPQKSHKKHGVVKVNWFAMSVIDAPSGNDGLLCSFTQLFLPVLIESFFRIPGFACVMNV